MDYVHFLNRHHNDPHRERRHCYLRGRPPQNEDEIMRRFAEAKTGETQEKDDHPDLSGIQGYEKSRMEHLLGQHKRKKWKHEQVGWNKSPDILGIANDTRKALTLGLGVAFPPLAGLAAGSYGLGKWAMSKFTRNPKSLAQSMKDAVSFVPEGLQSSGRLVSKHPWETLKATAGNTVKAGQHLYIDTIGDWIEDVLRARGHDADTGLISALSKGVLDIATRALTFSTKTLPGGLVKVGGKLVDGLETIVSKIVSQPVKSSIGAAIALAAMANPAAVAAPLLGMLDKIVSVLTGGIEKGIGLIGT